MQIFRTVDYEYFSFEFGSKRLYRVLVTNPLNTMRVLADNYGQAKIIATDVLALSGWRCGIVRIEVVSDNHSAVMIPHHRVTKWLFEYREPADNPLDPTSWVTRATGFTTLERAHAWGVKNGKRNEEGLLRGEASRNEKYHA
jgi:hypothetical protein